MKYCKGEHNIIKLIDINISIAIVGLHLVYKRLYLSVYPVSIRSIHSTWQQ